MIENEQLVFLIGVPGSAWSRVAHVLQFSPFFNLNDSDHKSERTFVQSRDREHPTYEWRKHHDEPIHHGTYFDPGMEFGHFLDTPSKYTETSFKAEIFHAFDDHDDRRYLIKSHTLANNIDWIVETFPGARIVFAMRDVQQCKDWWQEIGGLKIPYPCYDWYDKNQYWEDAFEKHDYLLRRWVDANVDGVYYPTKRFVEKGLGIDLSEEQAMMHWCVLKGHAMEVDERAAPVFETHLGFYNCDDLLWKNGR